MFVFDLLPLNSLLFISCITLLSYIHMLDIICVPTLVFNQETTLNLEELRGEVLEPFTGNSASLLVTLCVFASKFLIPHYLSLD